MIFYKKSYQAKQGTKFLLWPRNIYPINREHLVQFGNEEPRLLPTSWRSGFKICTIWLTRVAWKTDGWDRFVSIPELETTDESKMTPQEWLEYKSKPPKRTWYEAHIWGFDSDGL